MAANDRDVEIKLIVNGKQYEAELAKADHSLRDFGKTGKVAAGELAQLQGILKGYAGVAAAGAAVVGVGAAIANIAVESFNAAQASSELANKLGVSFNQLQGLQLAAENAGLEVENLSKGAVKLAGAVGDSLAGKTSASTEALKKLGITTEDLEKVQNDSVGQLALVADGLSRMEAGAKRTALVADLLGEKSVALINVLGQGGDVFRKAGEDARRFGLTLDDEALAAINRADDAVDELTARFGGLKRQIGAEVAPAIGGLASAVNLFFDSVQGKGIRINVETTIDGKPLGAAPRYGLRGGVGSGLIGVVNSLAPNNTIPAIQGFRPPAAAKSEDGLRNLTLPPEFRSGIVLAGSEESQRRAEYATKLAEQYRDQLGSLQKISSVERVRNELLKEKVPLDTAQAQAALEVARQVDAIREAQAGSAGANREAQAIRSQQERNRLLQAQLATGVDLNAAQSQLLLLNTQFEATSRTSLQAELEKGAALEAQLETAKELARQNQIVARESERDREALERAGVQFGNQTSPRRDRRDAAGFIRDEGLNGARADLDSAYDVTRQDEQQGYADQLAELEKYRAAGIDIGVDYDQRELDLKRQHVANLSAIDRAYEATKDQLRQMDLQRAGDFFGNLATVAQAFGKKGFKAYKAFAISQALISTFESAVNSYKSLSGIPYVGPVLGAAAAAAAVASGYAQVQQIRAQQPAGFQAGGYTGNGGVAEVAGVVHGQEFVVNAPATRAYRPLLEEMNRGTVAPAQLGRQPSINVYSNVPGVVFTPVPDGMTVDMGRDLAALVLSQASANAVTDARNGGPATSAANGRTGARRLPVFASRRG